MSNLNPQQQQAVTHTGSPLLIVAGAGTGKTTVITRKIAWLVEQNLARPEEILALTFTDKAAGEMEERVDQLLPYGYFDLWIQTFHSFGEKLLRQYALDIGIPGNFKVVDAYRQWALVKKNLGRFNLDYYRPLGTPTKFISALLQHFSRAKDELVSPKEYQNYVETLAAKQKKGGNSAPEIQQLAGLKKEPTDDVIVEELQRLAEVAQAYAIYQQVLLENEALDFGDVINYTLELCQKRPGVLQQLQERFKYILVDEFQDTNYAQYELVKLLAGRGDTLTVVGDDDQSIFRFRGASMSNILQFQKDYPQAREIVLTDNYRSAQTILDLAYAFIQHNNPNRLEVQLAGERSNVNSEQVLNKKLAANNERPGTIAVITGTDLQDEINSVVEKIAEIKTNDPDCTWNDFALLVRANAAASDLTAALDIAGFPYAFLAARGLYTKPAVMDIIAYFNLLDNYHESTALYRVLNIPVFGFTHEEIMDVVAASRRKARSLYDVLTRERNAASARAQKVTRVLNLIDAHTALAKTRGPFELMLHFLADSGYNDWIAGLSDEQKARETARELELFGKRIKQFEAETNAPQLKEFLSELNLELEAGEEGALAMDPSAGPEMIKVLTVHAAKGLEFKYVFVVNMVELRFPTTERKDPIVFPEGLVKEIIPPGDAHLEEERRLFYVAMTRAKQGLYFSWAPDYGGARPKKPSRFLVEAGLLSNDYRSGTKETAESGKKNNTSVTRNHSFHVQNEGKITTPVYQPPAVYSFTQLQSYDKCPYQYYVNHILKLPKPGKHFFSFGQTLHVTLQKFFQLRLAATNRQGTLFNPPPAPTKADLLRLYAESWIDDWYQSAADKEAYRQKGYDALTEFWRIHEQNWPRVIGLEQSFRVRVGGKTLQGKIDRIDELPDGTVRIIDYKTGKTKTRSELGSARYQLLLYQLAAENVLGKKPSELQFYYLEENAPLSLLGTPKDMDKLQAWVETTVQAIEESCRTGNFEHAHQPCRFCSHKDEIGEIAEI